MIYVVNKKRRIIIYIINFLGLFFYPIFKLIKGPSKKQKLKQAIENNQINNIYINLIDRLGDTVMATPMLEAIKNRFPNSRIVVLTNNIGNEVLKNNPNINKIILVNNTWISKSLINIFQFLKGFDKKYFKQIKKLRKEKIDLLLETKGDFRNIIFFDIWLRAKYLAGYSLSGFSWMLDWEMSYEKNIHETDVRLNIAKEIGGDIANLKTKFYLSKKQETIVQSFFKKNNITSNDFKIIFHIGGTWEPRLWPIENFVELAKKLEKKYQAKIILIGSKDEEKKLDSFQINYPKAIKDNNLSIGETAALIKNCDLFIGNDSGPAHIAKSVGTKLIALYGPDSPKKIGPKNDGIAIYHKFPCSPCGQTKCTVSPNCIQSITVEEVYQAVKKIAI